MASLYDVKCVKCGKMLAEHQAKTNCCPVGSKTAIGYTMYHPTRKFASEHNSMVEDSDGQETNNS